MARQLRFLQAINEALTQEMERDPNILVLGEDQRTAMMGATAGLLDRFGPDRVVDTPISEAGFTGMAVGLAMAGKRPIVEYEITVLPYVAMDQLVNQAMKMRAMTGGQVKVPMVVRLISSGAGFGLAQQHSDHLYPMLLNAGLKVILPSTPYDMKGLLIAAIRDDDPVICFETNRIIATRGEVPEEPYTVPLGKADVKREGRDVTVVATGLLVNESLKAAEQLATQGIDVEVVDPRTLLPLDHETILASVAKTGRCVIADDSNRTCGFAAEVAAVVADAGFASLRAPIKRVTRADVPVPFARHLEAAVLPTAPAVLQAIQAVLQDSVSRTAPV